MRFRTPETPEHPQNPEQTGAGQSAAGHPGAGIGRPRPDEGARRRRSPLVLGALSLSAGLVLAGCVPSADEGGDDPSASEGAGGSEESSSAESSPAEEPSSQQPSEDASETSSPEPSEEPSADDAESGSGAAAASGGTVELSGLPDAEPAQSESGTGNATFALEHPDGEDAPVYTSRKATGGNHSYTYFTGQRTDGSSVSMGGIGNGQTGISFEDPYWMDDRITDVEVEAEDGVEWEFDVYSIEDIPDVSAGQSVKGDGAKVFHWQGEEKTGFDVEVEGDGNFIVKAETADPDGPTAQTVFNEQGPGEGTMELPDEEYFITVESNGPWEFTAK
ncbi:hypothetical protein [Kocuria palustris]|uniref:hypothetical protein n=1 Tax=Kocuria palustris TaxID=71999 RepID=UPI0011A7DBBC|nr:hypothetical protein [Kocuria palustris]